MRKTDTLDDLYSLPGKYLVWKTKCGEENGYALNLGKFRIFLPTKKFVELRRQMNQIKPLLIVFVLLGFSGYSPEGKWIDSYNWESAYEMTKENPSLICGYLKDGSFECCDPTAYVNPKECLDKHSEKND